MNKSEVVKVITEMNLVDPRVEPVKSAQDPRIGLFYDVLQGFPYRQAQEAIRAFAAESHLVVFQIGHVVEGVKEIRGRNLDRVQVADLVPPDELDAGQFPEWAKLARQAIADGAPDASAAAQWADTSLGVSRRVLGESVGPLRVSQIKGQARMDVVAGELLVTDDGGES